jgi:hypothetical protein
MGSLSLFVLFLALGVLTILVGEAFVRQRNAAPSDGSSPVEGCEAKARKSSSNFFTFPTLRFCLPTPERHWRRSEIGWKPAGAAYNLSIRNDVLDALTSQRTAFRTVCPGYHRLDSAAA